ncbi:MAG: hypothetical protein KKC09_06500 [Gammaproteobacteria bacterium]|nr:hypothetical protein [Gammaproteobacteria bacterium]
MTIKDVVDDAALAATLVNENSRITASPHHRITASPHHRITASPHHRITASPRHASMPYWIVFT